MTPKNECQAEPDEADSRKIYASSYPDSYQRLSEQGDILFQKDSNNISLNNFDI